MNLTKKDVVVVALGSLQGATAVIDTEDVAIAAHSLAPVAFGWRKHTEHIDLDTVRTSLRHEAEASEPRVSGSIRGGWHLTDLGRRWLQENSSFLQSSDLKVAEPSVASGKKRAETRQSAAIIDRIQSSAAFKTWSAGEPITGRQAAAVFRIDEYTPARDRQLKTARISEIVSGEAHLADFVSAAIPLALALTAPSTQTSNRSEPV